MKVLVTGGAGYVGGFTARHLVARGHDVVVLDDLRAGHRASAPTDTLVVGDVGDASLVRDLLERNRTEVVIHFAGSVSVPESVEKPRLYWENNVANSAALLGAMTDCGVRRFVFSSSCSTYGEGHAETLHEDLPQNPTNPYAFSKLAVERMARDYHAAYGLDAVLLRYFNASGASTAADHGEHHDPETHLIPILLQTVLGQREAIVVYGDDYPTDDGTCVRDYVHVEDLAIAHERAAFACGDGVVAYNVGTGHGHSVLEVVRSVERVTGREVPRRLGPRRLGDVPRLVARNDRIREALDWTPGRPDLDDIVATAWEWHRTHPDGYA